jgi:hypothetical protein
LVRTSGLKIRLGLHIPDSAHGAAMQWTYRARRAAVIGGKSGHISVRTHVRRKAQILRNSEGMSGVLKVRDRRVLFFIFLLYFSENKAQTRRG